MERSASHFLLLEGAMNVRAAHRNLLSSLCTPDTLDLMLISNSSEDIFTSGFDGSGGGEFCGCKRNVNRRHSLEKPFVTIVACMGAAAWDGGVGAYLSVKHCIQRALGRTTPGRLAEQNPLLLLLERWSPTLFVQLALEG
eukprot:767720-Hanusia_phi.AAC.3